jgi:hypothetical protein
MGLPNDKSPTWPHLVFRAPTGLYRAGLGRLLGHRLVYVVHVVHTGRISGRRRETVLDVDEPIRSHTGYRDARPRSWTLLSPLIGASRDLGEQTRRELAGRLRVVAFSPRNLSA